MTSQHPIHKRGADCFGSEARYMHSVKKINNMICLTCIAYLMGLKWHDTAIFNEHIQAYVSY